MAQSTGPILALTAITVGNRSIVGGKPVDFRVIAAGGLTAGLAALGERAMPDVVPALAWLALVTTLFVPTGGTPSPIESLLAWWQAPIPSQGGTK